MSMTTDDEEDDAQDALYTAIGTLCNDRPIKLLIPVLSHLLVEIVTVGSRNAEGIEAFLTLFEKELRARWRKAQDATGDDGGESGESGKEPDTMVKRVN